MKLLAWFCFGLVGASAMALAMTVVAVPVWPVVIMALIVGGLILRVKPLEPGVLGFMFAYLGGFGLAFTESFEYQVYSTRMTIGMAAIKALLIAFVFFGLFLGARAVESGERRRLVPLFLALGMGVLIGFVSGDAGDAAPMRGWLGGWFSPEVAEAVLWTFRKTVHVVFYGLMALAFYRAAKGHPRAAVLAAVFALSHGAFDEIRQSLTTSRYGTPVDLLFDSAGVLIALAWARRR